MSTPLSFCAHHRVTQTTVPVEYWSCEAAGPSPGTRLAFAQFLTCVDCGVRFYRAEELAQGSAQGTRPPASFASDPGDII